jgi:hypothetical protein
MELSTALLQKATLRRRYSLIRTQYAGQAAVVLRSACTPAAVTLSHQRRLRDVSPVRLLCQCACEQQARITTPSPL